MARRQLGGGVPSASPLPCRPPGGQSLGRTENRSRSYIFCCSMEKTTSPSRIVPGLYIGDAWNAADRNSLIEYGIRTIVNASATTDCFFSGEPYFTYLQLPLYDQDPEDILGHAEVLAVAVGTELVLLVRS